MKQRWFDTRRAADTFADEVKEARRGVGTANLTITFDALVNQFATSHYSAIRSGSGKQYDKNFARLAPYLAGKVRAITAATIERFRADELLAIRSRQCAITAVALARAERRLAVARVKQADTASADRKLIEIRARGRCGKCRSTVRERRDWLITHIA